MSNRIEKIITPVFRVSFPSVFEPGKLSEKYEITMLFDKTADLSKMKAAVKKAIVEKFSNGAPAGLDIPFKDGNHKAYEGYQNTIMVKASSKYAPGVVDEQKQPIINPKDFYAGCYAIASVNVYYWKYMGKEGFSFGLQNLMKMNDGEPLAGGGSAEKDFESIPLPDNFNLDTVGATASIIDL